MASIIFLGPATILTLCNLPTVYRAARFALARNIAWSPKGFSRKDTMFYDHDDIYGYYKILDKYYCGPLDRRARFITYFAHDSDSEVTKGWLLYTIIAIAFITYKLYYGYPLMSSSSPFEKYVDDFGNYVYDGIRSTFKRSK